ncbi:MAG: hypothetical protein ACQETB_03110 [Halobacteriota archaeon]
MLRFIVGVIGLFELCYPERAVDVWTRLVYTEAGDSKPREWVHTAAKVEGTLLLLVVIAWPLLRGTSETTDAESGAEDEYELERETVTDESEAAEDDDSVDISIE